MENKKYALSVIIPIYNTELYLEQTIKNVLMQSLYFETYVQLILVDDCSTDCSGEICEKYAKKYPDNILYIKLPQNKGVSAARNTGMEYAKGKYVTFLDSDDLWSENAFERALKFLDANYEEVDLVSADIEYFDAHGGQHLLNKGLKEDCIIDVNKEYSKIRSIGSTCIIKRETANKYLFNEQQKCWEDTVYINQIIMKKQRYGMLASDVHFFYRLRRERTSATQTYGKFKGYFFHELQEIFRGIYEESYSQHQCLIPLAQYLIAYVLACRFLDNTAILNEEEVIKYDQFLFEIIQHIEDKYLLEAPEVSKSIGKVMAAFKYGIDIRPQRQEKIRLEAENRGLIQGLNRTKTNYDILKQWFVLRQQGKTTEQYFKENEYKQIAVYGMSDLGQFLSDELQNSEIEVVYGIDRRADKLSAQVPILTMEDELPVVDVCVVTAAYYFNQITEELQKKLECPIISIEDILYSIE